MKKGLVAGVLSVSLITGHAWAACAGPDDELAMKTSGMQQALMVAALVCHDAALYNRFVIAHRGELQRADAALMAFFRRENAVVGESDYHAFKTKAANVSALESARDQAGYCARAQQLFSAALDSEGDSLASFVLRQWQATGQVIRATCVSDTYTSDAYPSAVQASAPAPSGSPSPVPPSPAEPGMADQ